MSLVTLLVIVLVLAVVGWAIQSYVPGEPRLKSLAIWVLIAIGVLVVLQAFGVCDVLSRQAVPRVS